MTSDSWLKVRAFRDFFRYGELRWRLFFLLIADGEHAVEGLLVRSAGKETGLEGNVYEKTGYAAVIQGAPLGMSKDYSAEFEEVEPGFPAWSKWRAWRRRWYWELSSGYARSNEGPIRLETKLDKHVYIVWILARLKRKCPAVSGLPDVKI